MTLSITYNSYTISESMQTGKVSYVEEYDSATISVDFVISAASASALTTADATARTALTEWNQALTFTFGSTWLSFSHSSNTGFLARPRLTKNGKEQDTETSRYYTWTCRFSLPADATGYGGRQTGEVHVIYEPSKRRRVVCSAVYTAVGSDSAYTLASTNGPTWADAIISGLGGTYDAVSVGDYTYDHENKTCRFSRVYREQVENDKSGGQQSGVIDSEISYQQTWAGEFGVSPYPPFNYGETPPCVITASYRCTFDTSTLSTIDTGETVYRTILRPFLVSRLSEAMNLAAHPEANGGLIVMGPGESFAFSRSTCEMTGTMTLMAPRSTSARTFYSETVSVSASIGITSRKLWDGAAHTYARWGVGESQTATQTVTIKQLGSMPTAPSGLDEPWTPEGDWREIASGVTLGSASQQIGTANVLAVFEFSKTWIRQYLCVLQGQQGAVNTPAGAPGGVKNAEAGNGILVRVGADGNAVIVNGGIAGAAK